ncbi:MAG TPA: DUF5665 domain-containing protein [Clostridia bacterium]|nr:DUF5665 domain-containing protein [Clostridia bacterium]
MRAIRKSAVARMHGLISQMEKLGLGEYMAYVRNRRMLLWTNFVAGLARGLGMAIGFSILGAIVVLMLQRLAILNLPVIGEFLAEIIRMVQHKL